MNLKTVLTVLAATLYAVSTSGHAKSGDVQGWMTSADGRVRLAPMTAVGRTKLESGKSPDILVDSGKRYQSMVGFGASITDASAWLIQTKLTPKSRKALLTELFSVRQGVGFSVTRVPVAASDFSLSHYSFAETPGRPVADVSPAREHVIPTLRTMRIINPQLQIIATPWSAPAWMKGSGSLIKGRLKPEHYGDFARYLVSYTQGMKRLGVPINVLTIQNEPHFEPADYPGMRMEPGERAAFIGNHLGPLMHAEIPRIKLLDWDHNWDQPESPIAVLSDAKAARYINGVAWHCYAGDVGAQSVVRDRFPKKETWFTECTSGNWSKEWDKSFAWAMQTLVIGTTRNWARAVVMWNLALDEKHGPHSGGCGDCRGLLTIHSETGAITYEPEYYALAHASKFVGAGAVRIASESVDKDIQTVAFQHGKRGKKVMIVRNGSADERAITFGDGQDYFRATLPAGAVATVTW